MGKVLDYFFFGGVGLLVNGTLCCMVLEKRETSTFVLVDTWNVENKEIGRYDYLGLNDEKLWLISADDKWG